MKSLATDDLDMVYENEELVDDTPMVDKSWLIYAYEKRIDPDRDLILFTWSPNPEELPNADFQTQHEFCLDMVSRLLAFSHLGLACVEANLKGNPHYHGWFQKSDCPKTEQLRIASVKLLHRYAPNGLKFTKSRGDYLINRYDDWRNCLWYYKKEVFQEMYHINHNPITHNTKSDIDWAQNLLFFKPNSRTSIAQIESKLSNRAYYESFYRDSNPARYNK